MYYKDLPLVKRSTAPIYKGDVVLPTDVVPLRAASSFIDQMDEIKEEFPDSWYLQCKICKFDHAKDVVRIVPSIIQTFNKSRILRRAKISGLRLCNITPTPRGKRMYVTDMLVTSTFGVVTFAAALHEYLGMPNSCRVTFKVQYATKLKMSAVRTSARALEKFWRKTKLSRDYLTITPDYDCDPLGVGLVEWVVESNYLMNVVDSVLTILRDEVHSISFGRNNELQISRFNMVDLNDYNYMPFDKIADPARYRRFSAFGLFHNNPKYLLY